MMFRPLTSASNRKTFLMSASLKSNEIFWPVYFLSVLNRSSAVTVFFWTVPVDVASAALTSILCPPRTKVTSFFVTALGSSAPTVILSPPFSGVIVYGGTFAAAMSATNRRLPSVALRRSAATQLVSIRKVSACDKAFASPKISKTIRDGCGSGK